MDTNASSPKHAHLLAAALSIGATICAATVGTAYAQTAQPAVETVHVCGDRRAPEGTRGVTGSGLVINDPAIYPRWANAGGPGMSHWPMQNSRLPRRHQHDAISVCVRMHLAHSSVSAGAPSHPAEAHVH